MFAQEMQRRRAKLLVPTDQSLRASPTEVAAMLPSALPSAPRSNGEPSVRLGDVGVEHHGPLQHIPQQVRACADYRGCRQGFDFRNRAFLRSPFCWIRTIRLGPSEPKGDGGRCATSDLGQVYVRAPFMAVVFAGFAWMSFSNLLPLALTAIVGKQGSMAVVVKGWERASFSLRSGSSCARPTPYGVPFWMLGRNALCVGDQHSESDFPRGSTLLLLGRASALGIIPDRYRVNPSSTSN